MIIVRITNKLKMVDWKIKEPSWSCDRDTFGRLTNPPDYFGTRSMVDSLSSSLSSSSGETASFTSSTDWSNFGKPTNSSDLIGIKMKPQSVSDSLFKKQKDLDWSLSSSKSNSRLDKTPSVETSFVETSFIKAQSTGSFMDRMGFGRVIKNECSRLLSSKSKETSTESSSTKPHSTESHTLDSVSLKERKEYHKSVREYDRYVREQHKKMELAKHEERVKRDELFEQERKLRSNMCKNVEQKGDQKGDQKESEKQAILQKEHDSFTTLQAVLEQDVGSIIGIVLDKLDPIDRSPNEKLFHDALRVIPHGSHVSNAIKAIEISSDLFEKRVEQTRTSLRESGLSDKKAKALGVFFEDFENDTGELAIAHVLNEKTDKLKNDKS